MVANALVADASRQQLLDSVPPPEVIRQLIDRRIEEGRILRSLMRISQKIARRKRELDAARELSHA